MNGSNLDLIVNAARLNCTVSWAKASRTTDKKRPGRAQDCPAFGYTWISGQYHLDKPSIQHTHLYQTIRRDETVNVSYYEIIRDGTRHSS